MYVTQSGKHSTVTQFTSCKKKKKKKKKKTIIIARL
jgi:hypothetical protein